MKNQNLGGWVIIPHIYISWTFLIGWARKLSTRAQNLISGLTLMPEMPWISWWRILTCYISPSARVMMRISAMRILGFVFSPASHVCSPALRSVILHKQSMSGKPLSLTSPSTLMSVCWFGWLAAWFIGWSVCHKSWIIEIVRGVKLFQRRSYTILRKKKIVCRTFLLF